MDYFYKNNIFNYTHETEPMLSLDTYKDIEAYIKDLWRHRQYYNKDNMDINYNNFIFHNNTYKNLKEYTDTIFTNKNVFVYKGDIRYHFNDEGGLEVYTEPEKENIPEKSHEQEEESKKVSYKEENEFIEEIEKDYNRFFSIKFVREGFAGDDTSIRFDDFGLLRFVNYIEVINNFYYLNDKINAYITDQGPEYYNHLLYTVLDRMYNYLHPRLIEKFNDYLEALQKYITNKSFALNPEMRSIIQLYNVYLNIIKDNPRFKDLNWKVINIYDSFIQRDELNKETRIQRAEHVRDSIISKLNSDRNAYKLLSDRYYKLITTSNYDRVEAHHLAHEANMMRFNILRFYSKYYYDLDTYVQTDLENMLINLVSYIRSLDDYETEYLKDRDHTNLTYFSLSSLITAMIMKYCKNGGEIDRMINQRVFESTVVDKYEIDTSNTINNQIYKDREEVSELETIKDNSTYNLEDDKKDHLDYLFSVMKSVILKVQDII